MSDLSFFTLLIKHHLHHPVTGEEENSKGKETVSVSQNSQRTEEEMYFLPSMSGYPTLSLTMGSTEKQVLPMRQSQSGPASTQGNQKKNEAGQTNMARAQKSK